ncbi:MAG: glycosyltransferase, partial [Acidimicrobiia bacterium]|nr:glycosyltransferase [Acidimicrobiia bacterium]
MRIVFVSTELHPAIPGGAGSVIAEVGARLVRAGHEVLAIVVAEEPDGTVELPFAVQWVAPGVPDELAPDRARANSRAAAEAVAALDPPPDLVEFQDFDGLGLWSLMRRVSLGLTGVPMAVRMHGPIGLVLDGVGVEETADPVLRTVEAEAFRMADLVIVPSPAMADLVGERYDLDRVRIGEPPVPPVTPVERAPAPAPEIVSYGRLGEEKGSEALLRAAVPILSDYPSSVLRFVGPDGWRIETGQSMRGYLQSLIPPDLADRVKFEPPIDRRRLGATLASAWFAVFPSRFESFCLSAHECRALGIPLVLPQLPAFRPYFGFRTGALIYDGTTRSLEAAMRTLIDRPAMRQTLADASLPTYRDPLEPYRPVTPRHRRTQSGLATAALRRLEAAGRPESQPMPAADRRAIELLESLPAPIADRVAAAPVDHRMVRRWQRRHVGSAWEREWMDDLRAASSADRDEPEISIVIPCYNQGRFLHDAIRSVFRQDHDSWEIIVVDDGSTDRETTRVLRHLRYPRTRILRQRNQGLSAARNAGMRAARGRFFVPLDADDELGPGFLSATRRALEADESAAYAHTWTRLFGNQKLVWVDRPFNPYQLLLSTSVVGCALIRADAWHQVGGYDQDRRTGNEDWDLWIRLLEAGWGQVEVPRPLFRYRQHGISMSVTTEARFEDARREIARAHPALYHPDALRATKAEWYPWVSVVVDGETVLEDLAAQTLDDAEVVVLGLPSPELTTLCHDRHWPLRAAGGQLADGVRAARGKFLIDWRPVSEAGPT